MKLFKLDYNTTINLEMIIEIDHENKRLFMVGDFEHKLYDCQYELLMKILNKYYP
jgi:hypothetical protein